MIKDSLLTLGINLVGWTILFLPAFAIYTDNTYALWASYGVYVLLYLYTIWYMIGTFRCTNEVARMIAFELKETATSISYIPVIAIIAISIYAYLETYYKLSALVLLPLVTNWISHLNLQRKAKLEND